MNLVVYNASNDTLKEAIINFLDKDNYDRYLASKDKNDPNMITEIVANMDKGKIFNACYYSGTKDTKFVELSINNQEGNKKRVNSEFLTDATSYAFDRLNAETIVVFSQKDDSNLLAEGYESLGLLNDKYIYIKDKEDYKELRAVK